MGMGGRPKPAGTPEGASPHFWRAGGLLLFVPDNPRQHPRRHDLILVGHDLLQHLDQDFRRHVVRLQAEFRQAFARVMPGASLPF